MACEVSKIVSNIYGKQAPVGAKDAIAKIIALQETLAKDDIKLYQNYDIKEFEKAIDDIQNGNAKPAEETKQTTPTEPQRPEFDKLPSYKEGQKTLNYAGIGSRETPQEVQIEMYKTAKFLEKLGYTLQSGGATGADKAFEGANQPWEKVDGTKAGTKVFVNSKAKVKTWAVYSKGKKNSPLGKRTIFKSSDANDRTRAIAKEIHPKGQALSAKDGLDLHARNTFQVFGANLDSPVDFVLFYAEETNNPMRPAGGTGQAVEMARRKGIPTINMAQEGWGEKLREVLGIDKDATKVEPDTKAIAKKNVSEILKQSSQLQNQHDREENRKATYEKYKGNILNPRSENWDNKYWNDPKYPYVSRPNLDTEYAKARNFTLLNNFGNPFLISSLKTTNGINQHINDGSVAGVSVAYSRWLLEGIVPAGYPNNKAMRSKLEEHRNWILQNIHTITGSDIIYQGNVNEFNHAIVLKWIAEEKMDIVHKELKKIVQDDNKNNIENDKEYKVGDEIKIYSQFEVNEKHPLLKDKHVTYHFNPEGPTNPNGPTHIVGDGKAWIAYVDGEYKDDKMHYLTVHINDENAIRHDYQADGKTPLHITLWTAEGVAPFKTGVHAKENPGLIQKRGEITKDMPQRIQVKASYAMNTYKERNAKITTSDSTKESIDKLENMKTCKRK